MSLTLKIILFSILFILFIILIILIIKNYNIKDDNNDSDDDNELIVINKTGMDIIIESRCTVIKDNKLLVGGPIPGYKPSNDLKNNGILKFKIPDEGLASVKLWAKFGCENGKCLMGQSMQDWDEDKKASIGGCKNSVYGCTPPIDTIFEATFGCNSNNCAKNPSNLNETLLNDTFFDISHVDGYTLPYKLEIIGDNTKCDNNLGLTEINGINLTLDKCPDENKLYLDGKLVGCMSPCQTLTSSFGKNYTTDKNDNVKQFSEDAVRYCCPTPSKYLMNDGTNNVTNECTIQNGCTSSENCGELGIKDTQYYKLIKKIVPNNYAFAYDDSNGLHTCPRKNIKFVMTFYAP